MQETLVSVKALESLNYPLWAIFKSNLSQALNSYMIKSEITGQILFSVIPLKPIEINVRLDLCNREEFGLLSLRDKNGANTITIFSTQADSDKLRVMCCPWCAYRPSRVHTGCIFNKILFFQLLGTEGVWVESTPNLINLYSKAYEVLHLFHRQAAFSKLQCGTAQVTLPRNSWHYICGWWGAQTK